MTIHLVGGPCDGETQEVSGPLRHEYLIQVRPRLSVDPQKPEPFHERLDVLRYSHVGYEHGNGVYEFRGPA